MFEKNVGMNIYYIYNFKTSLKYAPQIFTEQTAKEGIILAKLR